MVKHEKLKDLEQIISDYQDSMFKFAFFRTGSLADSEDIVQNVFLKMYENKIDLSTVVNIKSYLFKSISNKCLNYRRREKVIKVIPLEAAENKTDDDKTSDIIQEYERIKKLFDLIPEEQAEVIQMRTIDGLAFTEISEILEIPITTVKSRFKYGVDKIKSKINNRRF